MKKVAFLEYGFMFDPETTFANVFDFENKLAEFFKACGYEAQVLDTVRGQMGRGIFFITKLKKDILDTPPNGEEVVIKK